MNLFQAENSKFAVQVVDALLSDISGLSVDEQIEIINQIKLVLRKHSPLSSEPVDCVLWVKNEQVQANDYNPNSVAPPEMKLLEHSILNDGYTQPIVTFNQSEQIENVLSGQCVLEVIDGFHRNRVGKESQEVKTRIHGYLPVVWVNQSRTDKGDRMASTIRHNRARGKHKVDSMSDIVMELKRRNWSDEKIGTNLGMEPDEVLRLAQITGLAEMFADKYFSEAWEPEINEIETAEL